MYLYRAISEIEKLNYIFLLMFCIELQVFTKKLNTMSKFTLYTAYSIKLVKYKIQTLSDKAQGVIIKKIEIINCHYKNILLFLDKKLLGYLFMYEDFDELSHIITKEPIHVR